MRTKWPGGRPAGRMSNGGPTLRGRAKVEGGVTVIACFARG
ncbi:MAG: hypothetical protein Q8P22_03345 [Chloroflexota bacterium]|nr:hypothetical protein [Chloroflexota bacterium]